MPKYHKKRFGDRNLHKILRIATRKSPLALRQTEIVAEKLQTAWPGLKIELLAMTTQGDELLAQKLLNYGGKGLFVKELEQALLENRADIAVHSMKDMPAQLPNGLKIACINHRDNPFDALVGCSLEALKPGAKIGTSSLRRQAQLLAWRPDLEIISLRGNINTRLHKLKMGEFDALVLAAAGLERMGFTDIHYQLFAKNVMLPACAQGAIGIETRGQDQLTQELLQPIHDTDTDLCIRVEREINRLLGGHCHVPIAIFAELKSPKVLEVEAKVFSSDGTKCIQAKTHGPQAMASNLAQECAQSLIDQGALQLLAKS